MNDNTFAMAMRRIVAEAETEREREARLKRHHHVINRLRSVISFLMVAGCLVTAFCYREQLQTLLLPNAAVTQTGNETSASMKTARDNAAARDKVVDEVTR